MIKSVTTQLPPPPTIQPVQNLTRLNPFEASLNVQDIQILQAVLCGPTGPTGPLGPSDSAARQNLKSAEQTITLNFRAMLDLRERYFDQHKTANNCTPSP